MSRRRARPAAGLLVLGLLLAAGDVGPAHAQQPEGPRPRLVTQTPWVADGQPFTLAFALEGGLPPGGTVELTLYGALTSREALARGEAEPALLGPTRDHLSVPNLLVPRRADGAFRLQLATDGSPAGLPVAPPGVYPLAVAVAEEDGEAGPPLLTWLVRPSEEAVQSPLRTAVVLPLHTPPSFAADGEPVLSDRARVLLDTRSRLLAKFDDVALTVDATPELLDAAGRVDPDLLDQVRSSIGDRHVVGGTYVRVDLAAFAAVPDLARPLDEQFDAGNRALRRRLRRPIDRRTWTGAGNPTGNALDALAGAGVDRALFRQESIAFPGAPTDRPVVVASGAGERIPAVLADAALRRHVDAAGAPVLMAHRALADLALLAMPAGEGGVAAEAAPGGVVMKLPPNQPLPAAFLDSLLGGLQAGGPVRAVGLDDLFGTGPGPTVPGAASAGQDLTGYGRNLEATTDIVDGYVSFAGRDDLLAADLRRRLHVSGSNDLTESRRGAYLRSVSLSIAERTAAVAITDDETITLTSREGDIPLTIHNDTGDPVEVRVSFDSDNKLDFPDGDTQRLDLAEGPNRLSVPVVARASGAFPLRITATSPDGVLTVSRAQVTVRSTVVSGVGVVLSVGALLVLVGWWAMHWRSTRRNRRLVDRVEPTAGNPGAAGPV